MLPPIRSDLHERFRIAFLFKRRSLPTVRYTGTWEFTTWNNASTTSRAFLPPTASGIHWMGVPGHRHCSGSEMKKFRILCRIGPRGLGLVSFEECFCSATNWMAFVGCPFFSSRSRISYKTQSLANCNSLKITFII